MSPGNNENNENEMENSTETDPVESTETDNSPESEEIDKMRENYSELNNRFLRLAADFDNYKKRVSKEKSDLFICIKLEEFSNLFVGNISIDITSDIVLLKLMHHERIAIV